ncbi:hypothetical protein ACPPVO_42040 [Dactylosporangium sp. McL0621]
MTRSMATHAAGYPEEGVDAAGAVIRGRDDSGGVTPIGAVM